MPHLSLRISPGGPLLQFQVGVSQPRAAALTAGQQPVPSPVIITGLVDTGASCTSIDETIIAALGIPTTGSTTVHTPSTQATAPHIANMYDISVALIHPLLTRHWRALPVLSAHLLHQGIQALLGRDILAHCILTYDGAGGNFCLAF